MNQQINSQQNIFSYNVHNLDDRFYPVNGSITITNLDTVLRNIDAIFSAQTSDAAGNDINFTNGKIHIVNWEKF